MRLAGVDTPLAIRHRLYLEIVPNGVPFFPHAPKWLPHDLELAHFSLEVLGVTDVVVSKLKRFHGDDRDESPL